MGKWIFLWLLIFPYCVFAQTSLKGKVTDSLNQPIKGANILITTDRNNNAVTFGFTDNTGAFHLTFTDPSDSLKLNVRSMGFQEEYRIIKNSSQIQNFVLREESILLNEVLLKAPKPILKRGDTLVYQVSSFSQEQDRSIGDVISRMPGIEIQSNGRILYQGKPINKYYIDNLDLLGGQYDLANKNLPNKAVAQVQIIQNHQPIKMLDSLVFSDQAAINIKLKDKNTFTGQAELGMGMSPLLWDLNFTPMLFSNNSQMIGTYQANNTGNDLSSQLADLTGENNARGAFIGQEWLKIKNISNPPISPNRWLDNNSHMFSTNFLHKLNNEYFFRGKVSYINEYQQQKGIIETLFFTPSDTFSILESQHNESSLNLFNSSFTLEKNTKKNYLKNDLRFTGSWDLNSGSIKINNEPLLQKLNNRLFSFRNNLRSVKAIGDKLLNIDSDFEISKTPQNLRVFPGQFEDLFNDNTPYGFLTQKLNLSTLYTNNSLGFTEGSGNITFSPKIGFTSHLHRLESDISVDDDPPIKQEFRNNLTWFSNVLYLQLKTQFRKAGWLTTINTSFNYFSYRIDDKPLQQGEDLDQFTFDPGLFVARNLGQRWKIKGSAILSHNFGTIKQLHYAYILNDYRDLQRIDAPIPKIVENNFSTEISYQDPLKALFGVIDYSYRNIKNNLIFENTIMENGKIEINAFDQENFRTIQNVSGKFTKYVEKYKTSITLKVDYYKQNSEVFLNSELSTLENYTRSLGFKLETDIGDRFNATYIPQFLSSSSVIEKQPQRNTKQQSHQLLLNFFPFKNHYLGAMIQYRNTDQDFDQTHKTFSELVYRFTPKGKNIDFEINVNNVTNIKNFHTISISDYSYTETNYSLRPLQILLKVKFVL
ncbi:carboxypeptidase-like regulatory domain-containing protein [Salinimicrobium sp. CAU 1759]